MYAEIDDIKNYVLLDWDEDFDEQVESWIAQITAYINTETGRVFGVEGEESTIKKYDGNKTRKLLVDDFVELESVEVDGVEKEVTIYPANTLPKYLIWLDEGFSKGRQNVEVDAVWGYSLEVPEDIKLATTVLVAGIIQAQTKLTGSVKREKIGNYDVEYTESQMKDYERVKGILDNYRKFIV